MATEDFLPDVKTAAEDALRNLKRCAIEDANSPLHGLSEDEIAAEDGALRGRDGNRVSFGDVIRGCGTPMIESTANATPGEETKRYAFHSFGAQFSEVRVDRDTGEVRVTRHVAVFDVGRVMNAKTARSQAMGGIIQGIGMALL